MAITKTTISKAAGFGRSDVITQLEEAFTWLGWNGDTHTGIVTGINAYSGGGTVGSVSDTYQDVRPVSSTGIGTGASFYITRSSGNVNGIRVNRPGYGYTDGEYVTISPEDIGGSGNGAVAIGITVFVAGNETPISYGSTTSFYDSDKSGSYPWGVARHTIQANKKYGDTYRGFEVTAGSASAAYTLKISNGNGFHPWDSNNISDKGNYYSNRFAGESYLDIPLFFLPNSNNIQYRNTSESSLYNIEGTTSTDFTITSTNGHSYQLDLNIFRSSIDPNFAVFSYKQPTLSSTYITQNTFLTFFVHNFTTNLWDLDELYLGGITEIRSFSNTYLEFRTYTSGLFYFSSNVYGVARSAEMGYTRPSTNQTRFYYTQPQIYSRYETNTPINNIVNTDYSRIYYRNNSLDEVPVGTNSDFNAVIKGIPLSTNMIPCPYYLPDDFVLIDFDYATPAANIQQGDTITISGSEVYTVITGSYDQTTRTRGILFCARTV